MKIHPVLLSALLLPLTFATPAETADARSLTGVKTEADHAAKLSAPSRARNRTMSIPFC